MNDWQWWQASLSGVVMEMNEGTPHAGFYRWPQRQAYGGPRSFTPVAYWPAENGELNCRIGEKDVTPQQGRDLWVSVGAHPVTEETYRAVAERGEPWPDEHPAVPMGLSNRPPDDESFEGLEALIEDLAREAKERIEGPPIADQDEADRIANLADRLAELHRKTDAARAAEKKPHDEAAIAVQKRWTPLLLKAETFKNLKYKLLLPWERKKKEATQRAAEEATARGQQIEKPHMGSGTRGRKIALKTIRHAEIVDYDACLNHFKEHADVRGAVQALANRAVRAGLPVPGAKVVEEQQAV